MTQTALAILICLFFVTSVIGVVTGSNSLITVPVMFQFGIDEKVAVATNMFGLTFMNIGATIPFVRAGKINFKRTVPLIVLTLIGSTAGALLVGYITNQSLKLVVFAGMIVIVIFTIMTGNKGIKAAKDIEPVVDADNDKGFGGLFSAVTLTYLLTLILGVYGGLYSGGYVTILTVVYVAFFGMTFSESVATTKFINVFSSAIATAVFMWQGLIDYRLGIILAVTMFIGAYLGAYFVNMMSEIWLRRIFLATVLLLAVKTLYDFFSV